MLEKFTANPRYNENSPEQFWSLVDKPSYDNCWEYQGFVGKSGYGEVCYKGKRWRASRLAFLLFWGYLTDTLFVLHSCDNRSCCNPYHLRLGTQKTNVEDMLSRNRQRKNYDTCRGECHVLSKLTEARIYLLYSRKQSGESLRSIARSWNVSHTALSDVLKGRTWKHVPRPEGF